MRSQLLDFYRHIEDFSDLEYLIAILKLNLAPSISNIKVGNLINLRNTSRNLKNCWEKYKNYIIDDLKLDYFEFRNTEKSVLIYFYNNKRLFLKLKEKNIIEFLNSVGYKNCESLTDYFEILSFKFISGCPDEIGVFLGYPLKDVIDFKDNKKKCKCIGYWKCYNNEKRALKTFNDYDNTKIIEIKKIVSRIN